MNANMQIIKIGSDVVRSYYQNRQFNELSKQYHHISSQNQSLLNVIQVYRKLDFVDKFHIAMTLMEEAFHSQNEQVFLHNVHSANERFTEILCIQRPEGLEDYIYKNIIVGSYFGKFQYYAFFDDIPNMMKQFFACGTKFPLRTMSFFGDTFPKLFLNERFLAYLKELPEGERIVAQILSYMEVSWYEDALKVLLRFVGALKSRAERCLQDFTVLEIAAEVSTPPYNHYDEFDALDYLANSPRCRDAFVKFLNNVKRAHKYPLFCEEEEIWPAAYLGSYIINNGTPKFNKDLEDYINIKTSLLNYYREGLKELGGG